MTYITSLEQRGIAQGHEAGLREGLLAGIALGLELKFGAAGLRVLPEITALPDLAVIQAIHARLKTAATLEELRASYRAAASDG